MKKRNFTSGFKTKVVLEDLSERFTIQELGQKQKQSFLKKARKPLKIIKNYFRKNKKSNQEKENQKHIEKLIPTETSDKAEYISNQNFKASTQEENFEAFKQLLKKYTEAKLEVTSRIHAALPCLAFGTPVVFIHPNRDNSRFEGIITID